MKPNLRILRACALASLLSAAIASSGRSQTLFLDRWARQAGMGDASAAVFWGGDPDISVNPAVLAYHHGIRYSWSEREILPGLVDGSFSSHRVTAAHAGVGLAYATGSLNMNGAFGFPPDQDSQEDWSGGIALAVAPLFEALATGRGRTPPGWTRFADLALGYSRNSERWLHPDGTEIGKLNRSDVGGLVRITPLDLKSPSLPVRFDLSYGWSALNVTEAELDGMNTDKLIRNGFGSRIVIGWPDGAPLPAWLLRLVNPLLSAGGALDLVDESTLDTRRLGGEFCLANVFYLRRGHWERSEAGIDAPTDGWGVGLQAPGFGSVRYDEAMVPQCCGIPDAWHQGFTASLDLLGILAASRR